jgi:hypothetical protein
MKKLILPMLVLCAAFADLSAQSKAAVNAMQQAAPVAVNTNPTIQSIQPQISTQAVSGYYQEGFEATTFAPTGWQVVNQSGPSYTWARSVTQAHLSTASAFIRYDAGTGLDWLITPHYNVTAASDSLVFWMRLAYQGYAPDSLAIKVSTTDSATSSFTTTLLHLREGVNYPPNATTWYRYAVSLQNYNGQQIYLAFKHYNANGDGLYIDNVAIGTRPAAEVGTTAITSPAATIGAGSIVPQATVYNYGTATQTFNVTTVINPGGYTSTSTVTALASAASSPVSFAAWNATAGTYTVTTYTQLAGDPNTANDTVTKVVNVLGPMVEYGWESMAALPGGRWGTAPVFVNNCMSGTDTGYVYLVSGYDAAFANSTLNTRFNTVTGTYTSLAPIPQSRGQLTPLEVNGKIYVIGGYAGSFAPVNTTSIYDIATDTWSTGAPIPQQTGDYAAGVYNDSLIYIIGGYSGSTDINLVQIYDTYTNTWSSGTPKTGTAVSGCRMGITGNTIVFVGGYNQSLGTQSAAYTGVINPSAPGTITWTSMGAYPGGTSGRLGGGVALENNGLVYFCAGDPTGTGTLTLNTLYGFNTVSGLWESGPNMPVGVSNISGLAGAVYNDSLYIVTMGGYNGVSVETQNAWLNIGPAMTPYAQSAASMCIGNMVMIHGYDALTYSWSPAATLSNPNVDMPMASPTTTTTYTVTMDRGYGCVIVDSTVVTVNALPTVTASSTAAAVCDGDPVTLTGGGALNYSWTGAVSDNVPFVPVTTDSYTVTGTDMNGCTNTASITVIVNALPTVGAASTASAICAGDSVMVMGNGAGMYAWTGGVSDNVAFAPAVTDTYTVTGTDANGCSDTASVMITVNALPVVTVTLSVDTACSGFGNMITLDGESPMGGTWSGNSVSGNMFDVDSASMGSNIIMYTYTDANGCTAMTTDSIYVDLCMSVNENTAGNVSVYPNPTNGEFTVQLNGNAAAIVEIMNELGQVVNAFTMTSSVRTVDMKNFESGVYFIRVTEGDATTTHRLIKH